MNAGSTAEVPTMKHGGEQDTSVAPMLERGAFVVSIDTEMAWGEAHRRGASDSPMGASRSPAGRSHDREREVIARILDIFARHEITATWAVVGHLFLDECHDSGAGPHPEIIRASYAWLDGDWFDIDPCTSLGDHPSFYGPDIVDAILACPTPQEIGSHSFSHLIVDDPACTPEVFTSDLVAAATAAAQRGLELRSFVYPRNGIAQVERLSEHGYRSYRGRHPSPSFAGRAAWQQIVLRAADRVYPLGGSAARPLRHASGVWNIPQSYYLFGPITGRRLLPTFHTYRPIARLRQAARHRSVFHMWFHPHNVIAQPGGLKTLERICAAAAALRDARRIDVVTMGALATQLDTAQPVA
jgi:peptidoglycan/xylan/chitin deacetylase (PgdA/CDA1 family)